MKNLFKFILLFVFAGTALVSCSKDDDQKGTAAVSFILVDAPGDFDKVLVNVQSIEVIVDGEALQFAVNEPGQVDLLELTGGSFASLLSENIPAGRLSQIRLILGTTGNEVVKENMEVVSLQTPSAQQTGLKLNVNYDLQPGVTYDFILDFNVGESVVELGAGQGFILKPVIRVTTKAESGAIAGMVSPAAEASVTATNGSTEVTAYTNSETGEFLLYGVPEGTYTVVIEPAVGATVTVTDVAVQTGVTTQMDTVNF